VTARTFRVVGVQDFLNAFHFAVTGMHLSFDAIRREGQIGGSRLSPIVGWKGKKQRLC
jgi:hypothetical protein